jgi:hypothetical protein
VRHHTFDELKLFLGRRDLPGKLLEVLDKRALGVRHNKNFLFKLDLAFGELCDLSVLLVEEGTQFSELLFEGLLLRNNVLGRLRDCLEGFVLSLLFSTYFLPL